jgi:hypothetical protein
MLRAVNKESLDKKFDMGVARDVIGRCGKGFGSGSVLLFMPYLIGFRPLQCSCRKGIKLKQNALSDHATLGDLSGMWLFEGAWRHDEPADPEFS